jgi:hypothetical protein
MMWFWTFWLFAGVAGTFALAESYALMNNKTTLSRWVWTVSKAFPAFPWIAGVLTGFLAAHFWWGGAFACFAQP